MELWISIHETESTNANSSWCVLEQDDSRSLGLGACRNANSRRGHHVVLHLAESILHALSPDDDACVDEVHDHFLQSGFVLDFSWRPLVAARAVAAG